jgi:hypothetical protein
MPLDYYERECDRFLKRFQHWEDPTWGFYVYGSYARPSNENSDDTAGEI